jgi:uncharacterized protein
MPKRNFRLHDGKKGSALAVRVMPRASHNKIAGVLDDGTVKIHISAPPADGEANDQLIAFIAEVLNIPKNRIEIIAGETGRDKLISILDMDAETVHNRILANLD